MIRPQPRLCHGWQRRLGDQEGGRQVAGERSLPGGQVHGLYRAGLEYRDSGGDHAGVVDHDVQPPPSIQRSRYQPGRAVGVSEIPGDPGRVEASAAQFADPVLDPGRGGADHHGGAEFGEQPGGGETDAVGTTRPGDHRHPAGQVKRRWNGHCPILTRLDPQIP